MMRKTRCCSLYALTLFLAGAAALGATLPQEQAVSFSGATILTPDRDINRQLSEGRLDPATVVEVRLEDKDVVVNPLLRNGWTWLAAKGIQVNGQSLSFMFLDGRLYSARALKTLHRPVKFRRDVSPSIRAKGFVLAYYREQVIERELMVFVIGPQGGADSAVIGREVFGEEKTVPVVFGRPGMGVVGVLKMAGEYRPWFVADVMEETRQKVSLNSGWGFRKGNLTGAHAVKADTRSWESVDLPHCWNATDVYDNRNVADGYEVNAWFYRGPAWYRKEFALPEDVRGKRVTITFEGAFQKAEAWLNGKPLGTHSGGYTGFTFDLTGGARFGKNRNVLAIRVDNAYDYDIPPHTADYAMYGGLYRDVYLTVTGPLAFSGEVKAVPLVTSARDGELAVTVNVGNRTGKGEVIEVKHFLVNGENELVASFGRTVAVPAGAQTTVRQTAGPIPDVRLWSPDHPSLYTLRSRVVRDGRVLDEIATRIGFRWFSFHPDSGFFLNGKHLSLKGVNRHQDYPMLGIALPDSLHRRDMGMIKEIGANFVRLAHYPQDPSVLDACDSLGLLVWEEIPVVNSVGGPAFAANAREMMREMIERDYNHPSVILWGIANECLADYAERGAIAPVKRLLMELDSLTRNIDPTRPTAQAHNEVLDESVADITDVLGRNRYFGWYTDSMADFGPSLEKEHRDYPHRVIIISEYGAESKRGYHVDQPRLFDHSEDYQLLFHEHYWETISSKPFLAGSAVWAGIDFGSPFKVGNIPRINQKGIWDSWRKPKDLYYFYKSQWSDDPMVYIVSHTRTEYSGPRDVPRAVKVYSNCPEVELFVNGASAGKLRNKAVYRWQVVLKEGQNSLEAVGTTTARSVKDVLHWNYTVQ